MFSFSEIKSQNIFLFILLAFIPLQNIYLVYTPNFGMGINFLNVFILLSILSAYKSSRPKFRFSNPLHLPVLFFTFIYIISTFYGIFTIGELGEHHLEKLKDILMIYLIYFLVLKSVTDRKGIYLFLIATCLPIPYMFRVFKSQISSVIKHKYDHDFRISGTFMELGSNEIGAFYAGYSLVLIALFLYVNNIKIKAILTLLIGLNVYSLLYSYSRGSWLSFLLGLSLMLFIKSRKTFVLTILLLPLFSGVLYHALPYSVQQRADTIFVDDESERDESAASRFDLWAQAMVEFKKSPLWGIGFHTFHHINPVGGKDFHNYYVKILTEQGIIGLSIFLLILFRIWKIQLNLFRNTEDPLFKALALGSIAMLFSFALGNMFGDRMSHYPVIIYFWVYVALVQRATEIELRNKKLSYINY